MGHWRRNLTISWVAQVLSLSGFGFVIPFLPYYMQEIVPLTPAELRLWVGVIASAPAVTMAFMAPAWGEIADRYGYKPMLLRASIAGALLMYLTSRAGSLWGLLFLRALQGMFAGTVGAAYALVAADTPPERMSSAMGFLSSSNFVGLSLGPLIGGLAAERFGYRMSFTIGAAVMAVGVLLVLFFIDEPRRDDGSALGSANIRSVLTVLSPSSWVRQMRTALDPALRGLFVLLFLLRLIRTLPIPFLPLMVQSIHGSIVGAASIMGTIQAGAGLATALAGVTLTRLGDYHNRYTLLVLFLGVGAAFAVPLAWAASLGVFSLLYIAMTFFVGGAEPMVQSELAARTPQANRGLSFGVQSTVGSVGWALAPLIGSLVSILVGLSAVFVTTAGALAATEMVALRGAGAARGRAAATTSGQEGAR